MNDVFLLMCYLGFGYDEARRLPIQYRRWFLERLQKEINDAHENDDGLKPTSSYNNNPHTRAMQGLPPGRKRF